MPTRRVQPHAAHPEGLATTIPSSALERRARALARAVETSTPATIAIRPLQSAPHRPYPAHVREALAWSETLPADVEHDFSARFGRDFSGVRVHTGGRAAASAGRLGADAYVVGADVVFGARRYAPHTAAGRQLLAHELAHVALGDQERTGLVARQEAARDVRPAPAFDRRDSRAFADLLQALDGVGEIQSSGEFHLTVAGHRYTLTSDQVLQLRQTATRTLRSASQGARITAEGALEGYRQQRAVDADFPIVSRIVQIGIHDPGAELSARVAEAQREASAVATMLASRNLAGALEHLGRAEEAAKAADALWRGYHRDVVETGESRVRTLEFTRDASFVTLGVLALIATGGAAAGATTTVAGVQVGTVAAANVVATGAPIAARVASTGMQAALGDEVDWGRVAIDTIVDVVISRLGGRLSNGIFTRLRGNPAVQQLGQLAFRRIVASVLTHEAATAFRVIVNDAYTRLRGGRITWGQFGEDLLAHMTDPSGLFLATLMGTLHAHVDLRYGTPRGFHATGKDSGDIGEFDEMRSNVLYEEKNARGLYIIPPGQTQPQQTEAQWAERQIYRATVDRLSRLPTAVTTRPGNQEQDAPNVPSSTRNIPTIQDVQGARSYVFRIQLNNDALRAAVEAQLVRLRIEFPGWTFGAEYGYVPAAR
jgi:hypothetical protein